MKEVSIIIPAYNAEKYIKECIESILSQTYENIQIIIVNDGSTDSTLKICESFNDKRLNIINQANKGVSSARNAGKSEATGDYIIFVDADDTLNKNMIETLVYTLEFNNADISICGYKKIFSNNNFINEKIENEEKIYDNDEAIYAFLEGKYFGIGLWDKLIKREIVEKVDFEDGRKINEDKFYLFNVLLHAKKVYVNNLGLYNYMQREQSVTKGKFGEKNLDIIYFSDKIKEIIEKQYPRFEEINLENYIRDNIYVYRNIARNYNKNDYIYKYADEIREKLRKLKNNKNSYKKYNKIELLLICNFPIIYKSFLRIFDIFIRNRRQR